jgi:hypothetical protein
MTNIRGALPIWLLRSSLLLANRKAADFNEKADENGGRSRPLLQWICALAGSNSQIRFRARGCF